MYRFKERSSHSPKSIKVWQCRVIPHCEADLKVLKTFVRIVGIGFFQLGFFDRREIVILCDALSSRFVKESLKIVTQGFFRSSLTGMPCAARNDFRASSMARQTQ